MGGQSQCLRRRGGWGIFLTHPSKGRLRPSSALGCGSLQRGFLLPVSRVAEPPGTRFLLGHSGSRLCLAISLWDLGELAPLRRPQCSCLLNRGSDALSPSYVRSTLAEGGSIRSGPGHCGDVKLNMVSAPLSLLQVAMGVAVPHLLWAVLLLPLWVFGVPTEEPTSGEAVASSLPGHCQRCCDSEDLPAPADAADVSSASPSTLPYVMPEVRPYVNITILKGEYPYGARAGGGQAGHEGGIFLGWER